MEPARESGQAAAALLQRAAAAGAPACGVHKVAPCGPVNTSAALLLKQIDNFTALAVVMSQAVFTRGHWAAV